MTTDATLRPTGFLIDLDGTVWEDGALIPGALETIAALRSAGLPFRFLTNTTRKPRAALVEELSRFGIESSVEECFNAPAAAAVWLANRGINRVSLLLARASFADFPGFEIDHEHPDAVVIGDLGRDWTFEILDRAFRAIMNGAEIVALQKNRYWKTEGMFSLDAGPFVAALEYASAKEARLVGKPSHELFHTMAAELDLRSQEVAMVGDDLEADVLGARAAGLQAIAVRSGKYRAENEERLQETATAVLGSLADLPRWIDIA